MPSHPEQRGLQRLQLTPEFIKSLQRSADAMWYSHGRRKLKGTHYYSNISDEKTHRLGYAAFRKVGPPTRERLILATILSSEMKPKGDNISHFFNEKIKGKVTKHPLEPEPFKELPPVPNNSKN